MQRYPLLSKAQAICAPSREVWLDRGEAYFEIVSNASMPFRVFVHAPTGEQTVEVLGTHFDVKAYDDETNVTTTLLEGSVRLTSKGAATLLQPGQQGQLRTDGLIHLEPHADTEAANGDR